MSERKKMVTAEEIEEAALELGDEDFYPMLDRLSAQREVVPQRVALWVEEAESRARAVAEGRIGLVDADVVLADPDEDG